MKSEKSAQLKQVVSGIFEASTKLNKISEELLNQSPYQISNTGLAIAVTLMREGKELTVPQIAERFFISRQAVQRQIQCLLDKEIVAKSANPNHKRSPCYQLTEEGEEQIRIVLSEVFDPWINELTEQYGDLDLGDALTVLEKIANLL